MGKMMTRATCSNHGYIEHIFDPYKVVWRCAVCQTPLVDVTALSLCLFDAEKRATNKGEEQ